MKLIYNNIKSIMLNKLIIIYLIFLLVLEIILVRQTAIEMPQQESIYFAAVANLLSIVFFVFFIVFSYESFINIKEAYLFEVFSTKLNGLKKVWFSRLIVLSLLICISVLPLFIHYTLIYMKYDLSRLYYFHTLKSIVINFILVSLIGCFVGALLSVNNSRVKSYIKGAILVLISSPLLIDFASNIYKQYGDLSSFNIFSLINRIHILPPNLLLGEHAIYGLPMEAVRWESAVMITVILIIAILRKVSRTRKVFFTYLLSGIIILWCAFALIITLMIVL